MKVKDGWTPGNLQSSISHLTVLTDYTVALFYAFFALNALIDNFRLASIRAIKIMVQSWLDEGL